MGSKMLHSFKLSLKGTTVKKLVREDNSLSATGQVLNHWSTSITSLLNAIFANENAWHSLFSTFDAFSPIAASIYPKNDADALTFAASLSGVRQQLDSPPSGVESNAVVKQRIDIAKKDLQNLLARINTASTTHTTRLNLIREHRYYVEKAQQLLETEKKKPTQTVTERRVNMEQKAAELYVTLTSMTNQLYYEMDAIAVERLAATDRAMAAFLLLQYHFFATNPVSAAYGIASRVGLGQRVLIRDENRPWLPANIPDQPTQTMAAPDASVTMSANIAPNLSQHAFHHQASHGGETPMYSVPAINPNISKHPSSPLPPPPPPPMSDGQPVPPPPPPSHSPLHHSPMVPPATMVYGTPNLHPQPSPSDPMATPGTFYRGSGAALVSDQSQQFIPQQQHSQGYTPLPPPVSGTYDDSYVQQIPQGAQPPPPPPPPDAPGNLVPPPPPPVTTGVQQAIPAPPPPSVEPPPPGTLLQGNDYSASSNLMPGQSPAPIYTSGDAGHLSNMPPADGFTIPPPPPPLPSETSAVTRSEEQIQ